MKSSPRMALFFLFPSFIFVGLFSIFPIFESFRLSLYRLILTLPWLGEKMVGVENYTDLLSDPVARDSIRTTLIFIAVTIPLELLLGLGIAWCSTKPFAVADSCAPSFSSPGRFRRWFLRRCGVSYSMTATA
jgi:multiple sugar transport system permease protein